MYLDRYYLAYGSNLSKSGMAYRCPASTVVNKGYLSGYKLSFKYYLTIEKCDDEVVPVALWKIENNDKRMLDHYEGYPTLYHIENIDITIDGKVYQCFTYVMNDDFKYSLPTVEYYKRCIMGYMDFDFDVQYLNSALYRAVKEG